MAAIEAMTRRDPEDQNFKIFFRKEHEYECHNQFPIKEMSRCMRRVYEDMLQCAAECITLERKGLAKCIQLCLDCAGICELNAQYQSRGSELNTQLCHTCAEICDACAAECRKGNTEMMRQCADICQQCADACRQMAAV